MLFNAIPKALRTDYRLKSENEEMFPVGSEYFLREIGYPPRVWT
jgi:hypothetical protein